MPIHTEFIPTPYGYWRIDTEISDDDQKQLRKRDVDNIRKRELIAKMHSQRLTDEELAEALAFGEHLNHFPFPGGDHDEWEKNKSREFNAIWLQQHLIRSLTNA